MEKHFTTNVFMQYKQNTSFVQPKIARYYSVAPEIAEEDVIVSESIRVNQPFSLYCPVFSSPHPTVSRLPLYSSHRKTVIHIFWTCLTWRFVCIIVQITWMLDDRPITDGDVNVVLSEDKRRLHVLKVCRSQSWFSQQFIDTSVMSQSDVVLYLFACFLVTSNAFGFLLLCILFNYIFVNL